MKCNLNINGKVVRANRGESLLEGALGGGVYIPQDCCSGQCESCRVRVAWGSVDDHGTAYGDTVLACQSTLREDTTITFEEVPIATTVRGVVSDIRSLTTDVLEVNLELADPLNFRPGQYASIRFSGFPPRDYSPTARLNGELRPSELVLHIKRFRNGIVSSEFGRAINIGHKVRVHGPMGSAFLREPPTGRLLMMSSGTGWAPIWAMARAVCLTGSKTELSVVAGVRDPENLYMRPALDWLKQMGVDEIVTTVRSNPEGLLRLGTPDQYLPTLTRDDVVHVAGAPALVSTVRDRATAALARCYADPFTSSRHMPSLSDRFRGLVRAASFAQRPATSTS